MELYHASLKLLNIGEVVDIDDFETDTTNYYQRLTPVQKDVEDILEQHRPTQYCSRKKTIFLFDDPRYCFFFAKSQYKNQQIYVYEVEVKEENVSSGFPMCLVNQIYKELYNSYDCINIVNEYWRPQKEWQVKEYLAKSIKIKSKCQDTHSDSIAKMHYDNDIQQAVKLK